MTKLQRRLYMLFFMALFFLTAPIIVLFAQGYRFDKHGKIFVYSGSITVKSWPRDIDIYVNDKKQNKKTLNVINSSYTVNGIRPGKYSLRLEKDGYTSWEKDVQVRSGISTEMWNVLLFPIQNKETSAFPSENASQFFLSPREDDEIVLFSEKDDTKIVSLLNSETGSSEEIFQTTDFEFIPSEEKENIEWSSDNKRILIPFKNQEEKQYIIARIRKENLQDIIDLNKMFAQELSRTKKEPSQQTQTLETEEENIDQKNIAAEEKDTPANQLANFQKVRWMFDQNDELVILTKDRKLYYINIEKPEEMILIDDQVSGFDFAGNKIYYTQFPNNIVWEIKKNDISTKKQITNTPVLLEKEDEFLNIIAYDEYRLSLLTEKGDLYVYNNDKETGTESMDRISESVVDVQFSDDGKKLLFWTNNEIWCYMLRDWKVQPTREKGDRIFITRFSTELRNVQWMDDYENILFSLDNIIKAASLDVRDHSNIVNVMESEEEINERDMFYDKETQKLFLAKKENDKSILQSVLLIDKTGFLGL